MQLQQQDDPAAAIATFDEATKRFPASPMISELLFRSAEAALKLGKADDARERFVRAAESRNDAWSEDALIRAARLAIDQDDCAAATKLAETFITRFPKSRNLADARLVAGRAARDAKIAGQSKEAIAILHAALADDKPSAETARALSYYLGLAYSKNGQPDKAKELLGELSKTSADAQFLVGQGEIEAGQFAEAATALEAYLKSKPDGDVADHALAHLVHARVSLGELDAAFATLGQLAKQFPKSKVLGTSRLRVADAAVAVKKYDRAAEQFQLATESPDPAVSLRARLGLGWALLDLGHPDEAVTAFEAFVAAAPKEDPLLPEAALGRARALEADNATNDALAAYASFTATYPKSDEGSRSRRDRSGASPHGDEEAGRGGRCLRQARRRPSRLQAESRTPWSRRRARGLGLGPRGCRAVVRGG